MENQIVEGSVPSDGEIVTESSVTDEQIVDYLQKHDSDVLSLKEEFNALLSNRDFLVDASWVEHVVKGFKKPNIEKRLEKQLEKTCRKKLMDQAFEMVEPGENIKTPTRDEIDTEVGALMKKRSKEIREARDTKLRKARRGILGSE